MSLHEWHHVAAVIERATLKLYLDGALVGSRSTGDRGSVLFDFSPTPRHSFFARRQSCSGSFDGDVQSVKLWSRARNASELAQASGAGKELRCVGGGDSLEYCAVAEVDVGDDGARVVGQLTDRSGNGRDAARFVACPQEGEGMSISASSARLLARYTTITAALAGQSEERTRTLLPVHGPYRTENSPVITRVVSSLTAHTHLHIQFDLYDQAPASLSLADMCVVVVDGVLYAGSPNGDGNFKFVQVDDDGDVSITKPSASTYRACQVDVVVPHNSSSATLQIGPTVSFLDTSLDRNPFWKWAFGPVRTRGFNLADNGRGSLGHKEISMLFERVYTDGREWSDHLLEGQKCASVLDGLSLGCSTRGCPPTLPGFCRGEADCLFLAQEWCVRTEIVAGSFENVCAAISFLPDVSTTSVRLCGTTETVALSSAVGSKTILRDPAVFQGSDNSRAVGKELRYLGTARCSPSNPCGACVGHCDDNEDCGGSLECFHRADSEDRVPGCSFQGMHDMDTADYCFDPKAPTTSERLPEQGWEGSGHGPALTADGIGRMSNYDGCPYRWGTYEYWSCYYRGNYGSKEYRATTSAVGWALNPEDEALQWVENCGSSRTETNGGCRTVRGPFAEGAEMKLTLENIGEDHTAVRIRMRMYRGDWGWDNAPVRMYVDGEQVLETSVKESSFPHEGGLFSPKYGKSPFASYENVDLTVPHSGSRLELEISLRDVWYDITKSQFYFDRMTIDLVKMQTAIYPLDGPNRLMRIGKVRLVEDDSILISSATVLGDFACVQEFPGPMNLASDKARCLFGNTDTTLALDGYKYHWQSDEALCPRTIPADQNGAPCSCCRAEITSVANAHPRPSVNVEGWSNARTVAYRWAESPDQEATEYVSRCRDEHEDTCRVAHGPFGAGETLSKTFSGGILNEEHTSVTISLRVWKLDDWKGNWNEEKQVTVFLNKKQIFKTSFKRWWQGSCANEWSLGFFCPSVGDCLFRGHDSDCVDECGGVDAFRVQQLERCSFERGVCRLKCTNFHDGPAAPAKIDLELELWSPKRTGWVGDCWSHGRRAVCSGRCSDRAPYMGRSLDGVVRRCQRRGERKSARLVASKHASL